MRHKTRESEEEVHADSRVPPGPVDGGGPGGGGGARCGTGRRCRRRPSTCEEQMIQELHVQRRDPAEVPDQRVPLVDQYDQLVQQQLLTSLLGLGLLPVCNNTRRRKSVRAGDTEDALLLIPLSRGGKVFSLTSWDHEHMLNRHMTGRQEAEPAQILSEQEVRR